MEIIRRDIERKVNWRRGEEMTGEEFHLLGQGGVQKKTCQAEKVEGKRVYSKMKRIISEGDERGGTLFSFGQKNIWSKAVLELRGFKRRGQHGYSRKHLFSPPLQVGSREETAVGRRSGGRESCKIILHTKRSLRPEGEKRRDEPSSGRGGVVGSQSRWRGGCARIWGNLDEELKGSRARAVSDESLPEE